MDIVVSPPDMFDRSRQFHAKGLAIGFVPTMGALHAGHVSLLAGARRRSDIVVMSIFVNPTQFGPSEDFGRYPRTFQADCEKARAAGCDILFAPETAAMYPDHYRTYVEVEKLSAGLCGASRPGHFRGVATVVLKFLNIVAPDTAFFGQKDAQQVIVLKRMVRDLNVPVEIRVCPTVREADGLAMSSRNAYLSSEERAAAPAIYKGLCAAAAAFDRGERDAERLIATATLRLAGEPILKPEYVELVDILSLESGNPVTPPALLAAACRTALSGTRLIDNIVLGGAL